VGGGEFRTAGGGRKFWAGGGRQVGRRVGVADGERGILNISFFEPLFTRVLITQNS